MIIVVLVLMALAAVFAVILISMGIGGISLIRRSAEAAGSTGNRYLLIILGVLLLIPALFFGALTANSLLTNLFKPRNCLVELAKKGDTAGLQRRLKKGESPDANAYSFCKGNYFSKKVTASSPPLYYALQQHQPDAAKLLLESGAEKNPHYLIHCFTWEDAELFEMLLEAGTDPDDPVMYYDPSTDQKKPLYDGQSVRDYMQERADSHEGECSPSRINDSIRRMLELLDIRIDEEPETEDNPS